MISVLYVDDELQLLELGKIFLERNGDISVAVADSAKKALDILEKIRYDAIISDFQMPGMDGIEFLKEVRIRFGSMPFILFTGRGREEVAILALNSGADFYLQKGGEPMAQFAELRSKIIKAVSEQQAITAQQDSERKLAFIIDFLPDATFAIDRDGKVISWNRAIEEMTGVPADQMIGKGEFEYAIPFYGERRPILIDLIFSPPEYIKDHYSHITQKDGMLTAETTLAHPQGGNRILWGKASPLNDHNGEIIGAIESIRDVTDRRMTEKKLKESEEKFREMADMLPQVIYETDNRGMLVYANQIAFTSFGYSQDDFEKGLSVMSMIAEEDRNKAVQALGEILAGKQVRNQGEEYHARRKDGTIFPVTIYTSPIVREGSIVGLRGIIVDISGSKKIEEVLRERERILATLISNLPGFVYRCANDQKWTIQFISDGCRELTGYAPEDFIENTNISFMDIIHPDYQKPIWEEWQMVLEHRTVFEKEYQIITRSGEIRWIWERGRGVFSEEGNVLFLEGFITDVTERKVSQDMLTVSREQLSLAIEGSGVGLWDWNIPTGRIDLNEQWAKIIGYSLDELEPVSIETWKKYTHPDDLNHSDTLLKKHFGRETPFYECEVRMHHKDGRWIWILDRGKVVERDSEDSPVRMVGTHLDITTRKHLEEALRKANQQLSLLTGITRHDINNQLTMLRGYLELTRESLHNPREISQFLQAEEGIFNTIERQIQFTRYYQDMGGQDPVWQNLQETIKSAQLSLPARNIAVIAEVSGIEIYADLLFEKVVYNLIENALRYGGEQMSIIRFSSYRTEDGLVIICEDDGIGIEAGDKKHLFEHGYGKNTGFGLFLVREILGITDIKINETSEPGNGARFEMMVPKGGYRVVSGELRKNLE